MFELFIDTHYQELVLVLFKDGKIFDKKIRKDGKHSEYFISLLQELLEQNSVTFDDLSGIIVINGPGSFTGVRIGVVVAKMISYSKNIPLKALSYLQALDLEYDGEVFVGITDKNGVYVGRFNQDHELIGDYFYLSNKDWESFGESILVDGVLDLNKVYLYMKKQDAIEPHLLKPIYIKKIEVENG